MKFNFCIWIVIEVKGLINDTYSKIYAIFIGQIESVNIMEIHKCRICAITISFSDNK